MHEPIYPQFQFHKLSEAGQGKAKLIAGMYSELLDQLENICGSLNNGREMALVKTKLEEACFFSKKAMAVQRENQEP